MTMELLGRGPFPHLGRTLDDTKINATECQFDAT